MTSDFDWKYLKLEKSISSYNRLGNALSATSQRETKSNNRNFHTTWNKESKNSKARAQLDEYPNEIMILLERKSEEAVHKMWNLLFWISLKYCACKEEKKRNINVIWFCQSCYLAKNTSNNRIDTCVLLQKYIHQYHEVVVNKVRQFNLFPQMRALL